jgi:hypothetical protein
LPAGPWPPCRRTAARHSGRILRIEAKGQAYAVLIGLALAIGLAVWLAGGIR